MDETGAPDFRLIREVPDGWTGWVRGRLIGEAPMIAPLSQRPCAYYKVVVEKVHLLNWERIAYEARGQSFLIEDDSGRALVDPEPALVEVDYDRHLEIDGRARLPQAVVELLRRFNVVGEPLIVREGVLAIGEVISVHGRMVIEIDDDARLAASYREGPPRRLRVRSPGRDRVFISERSIEAWSPTKE